MSQPTVLITTTPPLPGTTLVAAINAAFLGIVSQFSGTTAPTVGPGTSGALVLGQDWLDTSTTPYTWRKYDGASWCAFAYIDTTNHQAFIRSIPQDLTLTGDISPTQIAANTDDYAPSGFATASVLRLSTDASHNITGLAGGSDGRVIFIVNIGSFNIVLKNETTSTAANRFALSADLTLAPKQCCILLYDSTVSRWHQIGGPVAGGGSGDMLAANNLSDVASTLTSLSNLHVELGTAHGDSIMSISVSDKFIYTNTSLTAPRAWTLPAANAVNAGHMKIISDLAAGVTATNKITLTRAGADTINGGTTFDLDVTSGLLIAISDGTSKWAVRLLAPFGTSAGQAVRLDSAAKLPAVDGSALTGVVPGDAQLFSNIPQNSKSAAYTTVLTDGEKHIFHPSADTTARIWTIDSNANVAYPIGTAITFVNQHSAGVITIAITSDTMRLAGAGTTGSRTLAADGIATALKIATTEWIISGTGLT